MGYCHSREGNSDLVDSIKHTNDAHFQDSANDSAQKHSSFHELNIEVQEASNIPNRGALSSYFPCVRAKLLPDGPNFETFESTPGELYWYRLFQVKQWHFRATHLVFSLHPSLASEESLGELQFSFSDLQDQRLRTGWFRLKSRYSPAPSLKLRVQFLNSAIN